MRLPASAEMTPADLIDLTHYQAETGRGFSDRAAAYEDFLHESQSAGVNPTPFLYTNWYIWQNPEAKGFPSVLDHFLEKAKRTPIDPAPFLDSSAFLKTRPQYSNMAEALFALSWGLDLSISGRLEDHLAALRENQRRVHASIRSKYLRRKPSNRKRLVWVQAGPTSSTSEWFLPYSSRTWDLMCNWYSLKGMDLRHGEIHLRQSGTKTTAIRHVLRNDPDLFHRYDQILFLDDDLMVSHGDLDDLFDAAASYGLVLFQPGLRKGSYCVWPDLFRRSTNGWRETTGVEIMMPGFTGTTLLECADLFGRSISGFGVDFLISEYVRSSGRKCGVVDDVGVGHFSKIDERNGAYYNLMRELGINQKLELYSIILEVGSLPTFRAV